MTIDDILQSILPRLAGTKPGCSIIDAVRGVQTIIVSRLLMQRSDLIQQALYLTVTDSYSTALPDGYASMAERPTVVDGRVLTPLNRIANAGLLKPGEPFYYDVIGKSFSLFPPPAVETTVLVKAYIRPDIPTLLDDDIPFQGAFDEVYAYGALAVLMGGSGIVSDRAFAAVIELQVDGVLLAKSMSDEQIMADAINYP